MKVLSRYIVREILVFFLITLSSLTGVLLTIRMLRFAALIVNRGVEPSQIATVFIAIVPTFLEIALPMSALLGVMLAFARLSGDSEIIVLRASGISLYQFLRPVLLFAILVTAVSYFVSIRLRPWGYRELSNTLFQIAKSKSTSGLDAGVFNKLGDITLYAEQIDYTTGDLVKVLVDDRRNNNERKITFSREGKIVSDESTQTITLLLKNGVVHEQVSGKYVLTNFKTNNIVVDPNQLFRSDDPNKGPNAKELELGPLDEVISRYKQAVFSSDKELELPPELKDLQPEDMKKKFRRFKIEFGQRFSMPFASFIMAFVGMALGIVPPRTQRTWGAGISAMLGLAVFVVYYGVLSLGLALAEGGQVKIWLALWLPNIVAASAACFMIYKLATEKWHSIAESIQGLIGSIPRFKFRTP